MGKKKYSSVAAHSGVHVSSTGHYSVDVTIFTVDGGRLHTLYWYDADQFKHILRPPQYLIAMANKAFYDLVQSGDARFYENNQEGIPRYEDLRYHDLEWITSCLKQNVELGR